MRYVPSCDIEWYVSGNELPVFATCLRNKHDSTAENLHHRQRTLMRSVEGYKLPHRQEQRPTDGSIPPACLASIRSRPENGGARDEDSPPLHQIPEIVGMPRVLPQTRLANAPAAVGLMRT